MLKVNSRRIILRIQYSCKQKYDYFIIYKLFSSICWSISKIVFHRLDFRAIRAYVISLFHCTKVKLTAFMIVCLQLVTISCDLSQLLISLDILKEHRIRISGKTVTLKSNKFTPYNWKVVLLIRNIKFLFIFLVRSDMTNEFFFYTV